MNKKFVYKKYNWLFLIILLLCLDISTKHWIKTYVEFASVLHIFPGINCCYILNTGLAFGLFSNMDKFYSKLFLLITIFIIMVFLMLLYRSIKYSISIYDSISYSMIIGGALGNLYDRILYGAVVDFIDLYIGDWHWPIFNIADMEISIGVFAFLIKKYCFGYKKY